MKLHSGAAFWLVADGLTPSPIPLDGAEECDALIVGAGITGALVADALTAEGLDVVLLDRREPGLGSTAASTALLQFEIDVELAELADKIGETDAARAYQMGIEAIDSVERMTRELGDCGFARRPSLYLASRRLHRGRLEKEAALRRRHNLPSVFWNRAQLKARYSFPAHGAIRSEVGGQVDPLRLTRALLTRATGRGARLYARTTMQSFESEAGGIRVETDRAGRIAARWIIFATGYEAPDRVRKELVALHSSYALATHTVETWDGWPDRCLVWESARPYSYLRTTEDNRIIIGGMDLPFKDPATRDRLLPTRIKKLEHRLGKLVPAIPTETAFAWAGTFGETVMGCPTSAGSSTVQGRCLRWVTAATESPSA